MVLAIRLTKKTLALNDAMDFAYALLGYIYLHRGQYEKAITAGERAIALNPNGADAHAWLGHILCVAGRPAEGLALLKKAIRLSPIPPNWYLNYMAMAYRMMESYDESLEVSKQALHLNPDFSMEYFAKTSPIKDPADRKRLISALRKAGLM